MIAEPPGEPYYIARIMEFVYKPEEETDHTSALDDNSLPDAKRKRAVKPTRANRKASISKFSAENYMVRVNWFYRPKDISKRSSDTRFLYVTMNSDICPIASIRGKCIVAHRDHIEDLELFRRNPDCFWFDKLFDRYILSLFDVVPTEKIINIPLKAQKVLCERFRFAIVEAGRAKDLCAAPKNCVKCDQWCSPDDSVQCAHCLNYYHMLCVDPPLTRKPSRGFGWSCAPCSGARERKMLENRGLDAVERGDSQTTSPLSSGNATPTNSTSMSSNFNTKNSATNTNGMTRSEQLAVAFDGRVKSHKLTQAQKHQLKLWPFRYLGVHAKIEDVLDMDDRIYPRAASRLGNKHQCPVPEWSGRRVVYYETEKPEKKPGKKAKASNLSKLPAKLVSTLSDPNDTIEEINKLLKLEKKHRPNWLQEKPNGYIERGGDDTAELMWDMPKDSSIDVELFLETQAKLLAAEIGVEPYTPNFLDACLKAYMDSNFNVAKSLEKIKLLNRSILKEPTLTPDEVVRFEEGVRKFGSELHEVFLHVGTKSSADIVRYYYLWKKTPNGHKIWDNYEGRKHKMKPEHARNEGELVDSIADANDDSKFDVIKAEKMGRKFLCKHCHGTESTNWQRAPGHPVANDTNPVIALCMRCARLWRKYACIWEEPEEVIRKFTSKSGGIVAVKRGRIEEELLEDAQAIIEERSRKRIKTDNSKSGSPTKNGTSKRSSPGSSNSSTPSEEPVIKSRGRGRAKADEPVAKKTRVSKVASKINVIEEPVKKPSIILKIPASTFQRELEKKRLNRLNPDKKQDDSGIMHKRAEDSLQQSLLKFVKVSPKDLTAPSVEPSLAPSTSNTNTPSVSVTTTIKIKKAGDASKKTIDQPPKDRSHDSFRPVPTIEQIHRPCAVCMVLEPHSEQIKCANCGVNVHKSCYGITDSDNEANSNGESGESPSNDRFKSWRCDACRNDPNPLLSTIYGCVLCPVRETNYDGIMYGEPELRPDALKRTSGYNWVHVKCAIWCPEIKFGDVQRLQPVEGVAGAITKKGPEYVCKYCKNATLTGAVVVCFGGCGGSFHVGCAERAGCQFWMHIMDSDADPSITFNGKTVECRPIIVCGCENDSDDYIKRKGVSIIKTSAVDAATGKTILQLYNEFYKQSDNKALTGARRVAHLYHEAKKALVTSENNGSHPAPAKDSGLTSVSYSSPSPALKPADALSITSLTKLNNRKCIDCGINKSPFWWAGKNNLPLYCHKCYYFHHK